MNYLPAAALINDPITQTYNENSVFNLIDRCFRASVQLNIAFAFWKLPASDTFWFIIDFGHAEPMQDLLLENSKSGFVIAPFDHGKHPLEFIHADLYFDTAAYTFSVNISKENPTYAAYLKFVDLIKRPPKEIVLSPLPASAYSTKESFNAYVNSAIANIKKDNLKKIVAAQCKAVSGFEVNNIVPIAEKLAKDFDTAFVSLIYHPKFGCWVGASPEQIAGIDKQLKFTTTALAGTQLVPESSTVAQLTWHEKEIEEQALVSRYISNCFKSLNISDYEEDGPKTVIAGNLAHLRTNFSLSIQSANRPLLASTLLKLLHPTSAVCGMPHLSAFNFIKLNEKFDRSLFTGYLGPVNVGKETNLYVNIRCAQLHSTGALVFAGAGITKDSVPEKEWEETNYKMQIIERYLICK